ncbi:MAG: BspA family leucine-rich repeat surface protein [Bacilli bacterium]|nr:BspA family leucine-rich repeat surface protein [Bacilli bacterium]
MKKGFTLIELLAVIVILAVIALIAIPSIMGIITKAKRGAAEASAYNYIETVETGVVTSQLNGENLTGYYDVIELENKVLLKGTKPSKGNVTLADKGKVETATLCINGFIVNYNGTYAKVVSNNCNNMDTNATLIARPSNSIGYDVDGEGHLVANPSYDGGNYFWTCEYSSGYPISGHCNDITSISFVNYVDTKDAVEKWDLSEEKNNSIVAWIEVDENDESSYSLYIGSFGTIYANSNSSYWFAYFNNLNSLDLSNFDTSKVTNMSRLFAGLELENLDLSNFDTSKVIDMSYMFFQMNFLRNLDLSNFDTSKVENMSWMFTHMSNLGDLNISNFDTSSVTNMSYMFTFTSGLSNLDLSNFDTSKVTNMSYMFDWMASLSSLNVSNFNTSNVTNMSWMFYKTYSLSSLDVSNFNTSKVTNMSGMFAGMSNLVNLNINNFNTSNVTNMDYMFNHSTKLSTIYVGSNWTTSGASISYMFEGCGTSSVTLVP